jgi:hypothetical protein
MIKPFNELYKVEVKATKKPIFKWDKAKQDFDAVGELDVISWVDCLKALYENGAERVAFDNVLNENGSLLFLDANNSLSIKVYVEIDGDRREIVYPVINGMQDIKAEKVTQSDIYNCKQRAFVKCVAINWGLGLNFWEKANPDEVPEPPKQSVAEQFRTLVNTATKKCGGLKEMLNHLDGVSEKRIRDLIVEAQEIDGIVKTLSKVLDND